MGASGGPIQLYAERRQPYADHGDMGFGQPWKFRIEPLVDLQTIISRPAQTGI